MQRKSGPLIVLDISAAFDEISFEAIEYGLVYCNVPQNLSTIIMSLVKDGHSYCHKNNCIRWRPHHKGVPQGSFSRPTFFNIGTAIVQEAVREDLKIWAYADYLTVLITCDTKIINKDTFTAYQSW